MGWGGQMGPVMPPCYATPLVNQNPDMSPVALHLQSSALCIISEAGFVPPAHFKLTKLKFDVLNRDGSSCPYTTTTTNHCGIRLSLTLGSVIHSMWQGCEPWDVTGM